MSSFDVVNYSLRPNKSIQRSLVFEGIRVLVERMGLRDLLYIGFGSVWFTDFLTAHRALEIRDMISIEKDEIGFARAEFNSPFKTVKIERGSSDMVLPALLSEPTMNSRSWLVWLDYDSGLNEVVSRDVQRLVEEVPPNSVLIVTFNGAGNRKYGHPKDREESIRRLLGGVVPDDLEKQSWGDDKLPKTLAALMLSYMQSVAVAAARPGGFIPAFSLTYRDSASMCTMGGVLPSRGAVSTVQAAVMDKTWPAIITDPIIAPMLTVKEALALQAELPRARPLTRRKIRSLGFDLEDDQIRAFEKYYRFYPTYAQIMM